MAAPGKKIGLEVKTYVEGFHDKEAVQKIPYREIGNTGMQVSCLALGASAFGSVFRETDDSEAIQVVHDSLKAGINYIDAAPWYGHGKAETVCGKAFKDVPRESYYFATKVGRYEADTLEMFDFSRDRTLRSVEESLARTGLEYLDVVQAHTPAHGALFLSKKRLILGCVWPGA